MSARRLVIGVALGVVVVAAFGFGAGVASGRSSVGDVPSWAWRDMQVMHDSPGMERMHDRMSPALAAECEEMHARMQGQAGVMGGQGMRGGQGMMGGQAQHEAHHFDGGGSGP